MPRVSQRLPALSMPMPSKLWTPQQTTAVAGNLSRSYERAPAEAHHMGAQFYPNWNEDAQHIGQVTGQGMAGGASILAHLSPSTEAETNRLMAMQLVHGTTDTQLRHLSKAAKHADIAQAAVSRRTHALDRGDMTAAAEHDALAQHHSALAGAARSKAGIEGTPLAKQTSRNIVNAAQIMQGKYKGDPLETLGRVKIRDFGGLINDPHGYKRSPIDTHYHDAALGRTDIPYEAKRGLTAVGRYESFQGAHALAHSEYADDASHGDFMATVWYHHQMNKAIANPESLRSRRATETSLANYRSNPRLSHFMPESHGLLPSIGKIPTGR